MPEAVNLTCTYCGKHFQRILTKKAKRHYCCIEHQRAQMRAETTKPFVQKACVYCGKQFGVKKDLDQRFCSRDCANRGRERTVAGHGTLSRYTTHKCRCDECRAAKRRSDLRSKAAVKARKEKRARAVQRLAATNQERSDRLSSPEESSLPPMELPPRQHLPEHHWQ